MTLVLPDYDVPAEAIDFGVGATWPENDLGREAMFAKLRRERPVSFHIAPQFELFPPGPGYWSLEPQMLESPFIHRIKHMTAEFTPR